jgi:DNA invertase Pin-like site-specific DNA recombinase
LDACLKSLRKGDTLVAGKLDRVGCDLPHLFNLVHDLTKLGVGLRVLAGEGAAIDTTTPNGRLVFGFFAALADDAVSAVMRNRSLGPVRTAV